eukprot:scaffold126301_cov31-Tisochrysis_lutea.AAC.4
MSTQVGKEGGELCRSSQFKASLKRTQRLTCARAPPKEWPVTTTNAFGLRHSCSRIARRTTRRGVFASEARWARDGAPA